MPRLTLLQKYPWLIMVFLLLAAIITLIIIATTAVYGYRAYRRAQPAAVATETFTNLLTTNHADLTISWKSTYNRAARTAGISQITGKLESSLRYPAFSNHLRLDLTQNRQPVHLQLEQKTSDHGTIYLRTSGLKDNLPQLIPDLDKRLQHSDTVPTLALLSRLYQVIAPTLDDTWWQADIPTFAASWDAAYPLLADQDGLATAYQCSWREYTQLPRKDLAALYARHPFLTLSRPTNPPYSPAAHHRLYALQIDSHALAGYINALLTDSSTAAWRSCFDRLPQNPLPNQISYNALDNYLAPLTNLYAEIDMTTRRLTKLTTQNETDKTTFEFEAVFNYADTSSLALPASSQPIFDLLKLYGDRFGTPEATRQAAIDQNQVYIQNTTPATRNADRLYDINAVADALRTCYDQSTQTYLADNDQAWGEIHPHQAAGPFAKAHNQCLSGDVTPAMEDYPYFFGTYAYIPGAQTAGFYVCGELEKTPGWQYVGNSSYLPDSSMYHTDGHWSEYTACTSDSQHCYYCRTNE